MLIGGISMVHDIIKAFMNSADFIKVLSESSKPFTETGCKNIREARFTDALIGIGKIRLTTMVTKFLHGKDGLIGGMEELLKPVPEQSHLPVLYEYATDESRSGWHLETFQECEFYQICALCRYMNENYWESEAIINIAQSLITSQSLNWIWYSANAVSKLLTKNLYLSKEETGEYGVIFNTILKNLYDHESEDIYNKLTPEMIALLYIGAMLSYDDSENYYKIAYDVIKDFSDISKWASIPSNLSKPNQQHDSIIKHPTITSFSTFQERRNSQHNDDI